jgi:hypothetical protein
MKSTDEQLKTRGFAADDDINKASSLSYTQLCEAMDSPSAVLRTVTVKLLAKHKDSGEEMLPLFVERLGKEQALYTRLALCEALACGGIAAALLLVPCCGKIGSNQYKSLPPRPSKKTSFPLPRDIAARTLGTMGTEIAPVLRQALLNGGDSISELVDAFGYLASKNPELDTVENAAVIESVLAKYHGCELIMWKCIVALSAFPKGRNEEMLQQLEASGRPELIKAEARRSLSLT